MAKVVELRHMTTGSQLYAIGVTWSWIRARTYLKQNEKIYGKTPIGRQWVGYSKRIKSALSKYLVDKHYILTKVLKICYI
jgi:hypothetical protein